MDETFTCSRNLELLLHAVIYDTIQIILGFVAVKYFAFLGGWFAFHIAICSEIGFML